MLTSSKPGYGSHPAEHKRFKKDIATRIRSVTVSFSVPFILLVFLSLGVMLPIGALLLKSFLNPKGSFVWFDNFSRYASEPGLSIAIWNSASLSLIATLLTLILAFPYAYALNRSRLPYKGLFKAMILLPILAPSLLPAFGLVYLFGNQGLLKSWLFGSSIYGPIGIVIAHVFFALPHAVLILSAGLASGDQRLYEAARALKSSAWRTFFQITLPACRYSLISAAAVVFVLVFTDFGIPTVIGGSTNVLATDIYKLVIGRFDFELGAVVGVLLLVPALIAYAVDTLARRTQRSTLTGRSVPLEPDYVPARDIVLSVVVLLVAFAVLAVIGIAVFGSLVRFWPYNMSLGLHNYTKILFSPEELQTLINSLLLATAAAIVGTALVMTSGWLVARKVGEPKLNQVLHGFAMVPLAVPGLVLGLGYVFFFNNPSNPLHFLQATMALLVMCTIAHYYTVPHLMAVGALVRFDAELDLAGTALKSEPIQTAKRIYLPILAPTLIDIAGYFFVNAMTTVSALIFLFTAENRVSAIAVINMTEGSRIGQATALAVLMMAVCVAVAGLQTLLRNYIIQKQTWRRRTV